MQGFLFFSASIAKTKEIRELQETDSLRGGNGNVVRGIQESLAARRQTVMSHRASGEQYCWMTGTFGEQKNNCLSENQVLHLCGNDS